MAHLDHKEAFEELRSRVFEGIQTHFPVKGRTQTLELAKLEVDDAPLHADDIESQRVSKLEGNTWAAPIYATFNLVNHQTGKKSVKKMKIAEIPFSTRRYSYIVDGQEYQVDNQWQLKPGVYTLRAQSGDLETRFNIPNKRSFDIKFDPKSKIFMMKRGKSENIPVYPLMKAMGIDDDTLASTWGKDVLAANRQAKGAPGALSKFFKADRRRTPSTHDEAEKYFVETMLSSQLRPDATEVTLGKKFSAVEGDTFVRATKNMLDVQTGKRPEDDRDSLVFKDLRGVGDYAFDKLTSWESQRAIRNKMLRKINSASSVREIVKGSTFNEPIKATFTKNSAANPAKQINPIEMVAASMRTTIMGPGGIKSEHAIKDEAKLINPSHLGFLDPLHTPECFDAKTEVFTRDGWMFWGDVFSGNHPDVEFACNIDGRLEFHQALKLHRSRYQGPMVGGKTQQLDFLVTPDHRMWVRPHDAQCRRWRFELAEDMEGKPRRLCAFHRPFKGRDQEFIYLPSVEGNNSSIHTEKVPVEDWAEFMGWFLTEGSCVYDELKSNYFVKLSQSNEANPENCEEIEALLERLPWKWCYTNSGDFVIGVKQLAYTLRDQGKADKKHIPEVLLEAPESARRALLEAMLKGDGRLQQRHGDKVHAQRVFTTTSLALAEGFERLAVSLGLVTKTARYEDKREERYLPVYEVRIHKHQQPGLYPAKNHYYREEYNGFIYCATVPGGLLLVRRNKSLPAWFGNSDKTGVTLHLPMGVKKEGKQPTVPLYNLRTGKMERVPPAEFMKSNVVLPDQVTWEDGRPKPVGKKVKFSAVGNDLEEGDFKQAQYVMRHPSHLFSVTSNLIPFMGNNSGNRASYATHHIEQAISLVNREEPLVQVGTGSGTEGLKTFEEFLGRNTAHTAPVDGEIVAVKKNLVTIKGADGKNRDIQLYDNFPLNDPKAVLDSTPTVQMGQKVKAGQAIADTNFTKNGKLALGTNLDVAYIPYNGYNFEDGVVISESAAKKLSSVHLHKNSTQLDKETVTRPKAFKIQHPEAYTKDQYKLLDDNGIIKKGTKVNPGDPLVLGTKPFKLRDRTGVSAIRKNASGAHTDISLKWESDYPGEVVGVHKNKKGEISVHVRTIEPMQVGDKLSGRYGNKGIVTQVVPDDDMPRTKKGQHVEVALNPSGVPGRMNIGQVLETAAAKVAKKTGKPYIVENFGRIADMLSKVKKDLKDNGLEDTEELFDPKTGMSLGKALMGPQQMLKLTHQIDKKLSVRSGMTISGAPPESYDFNLMPAGGGKTGGQSMGNLGMYAMLAHGAKANIREMQTWKSEGPDPSAEGKRWKSQHEEVWRAIQSGDPLPPPKPTFAFQKFTDMLRASGINVEKKGNHLQLTPLTDKQIVAMAEQSGGGALPKPTALTRDQLDENGEPKPFKGGLFDPKITGGHGGKKWSYFTLPEPMPNPIFEGAIQKVLGMTGKDYAALVESQKALDPKTGKMVALDAPGSITGGPAVAHMLGKLDVTKELEKAKMTLNEMKVPANIKYGASTTKLDQALKRVKYLRALNEAGLKADEAYTLRHVPVIPPAMRPAAVLPTSSGQTKVKWDDLNGLYKDLAVITEQMKHPNYKMLGDEDKKEQRAAVYDGLKALVGYGMSYSDRQDKNKGALLQISGKSPKAGFFQKQLLSRRQDLTMRSTIVPEPAMGLDEVGLPEEKALTLFRPFVVKKLVDIGAAPTPLDAQKLLGDKKSMKSKQVLKALDLVMEERPVLMKRDPALHKHSVQAFNARRIPGRAIHIHPLVTSGYNADFDGDTMSVFVPISKDAVQEARNMYPSNNLFNEATGRVTHVPTLESALGLYKLSRIQGKAEKTFGSPAAVIKAAQTGKLKTDQAIKVRGVGTTTAGRLLLSAALPEGSDLQKKILTDPKMVLDKKGLPALYENLARNHTGDFGDAANHLKDLGYGASFGAIRIKHPDHKGPNAISAAEDPKNKLQFLPIGTHTLALADFEPDRETRDAIITRTQRQVDMVRKSDLSKEKKDQRAVELWSGATDTMRKKHEKKIGTQEDNLSQMYKAGVKPKWSQYQQMKLAPMLVEDSSGRTLPTPVTRSYAEGLDLAGYWTQMHGARKGSVQKVQEVREPGFFSKQLINTTMNMQVAGRDCETARGVAMDVRSKDLYDRELANDVKLKGVTYSKGTTLTPDIVTQIRSADPSARVMVRSPIKCEHGDGICQKCAGLSPNGKHYELGTNLGVLSAQSLGERAVQLTLKAFHSGGVAGGGGKTLGQFNRVQQLTQLPKRIPDEAELAKQTGVIQKIKHNKTGSYIWIGGKEHFVPLDRVGRRLTDPIKELQKDEGATKWAGLKVGQRVEAGQSLSDPNRTFVNPHQLYKATGKMETVQNHMVNELHGIFGAEGVRRQHVETVVKAMGNATRVVDPGDAKNVLKGEYQATSRLAAMNRELVKGGKRPATHAPILQGIDMMPLSVQEDWMAKLNHQRLRESIADAAATGSFSNLHGTHPIPGMAAGYEFGRTGEKQRDPRLKKLPKWGY